MFQSQLPPGNSTCCLLCFSFRVGCSRAIALVLLTALKEPLLGIQGTTGSGGHCKGRPLVRSPCPGIYMWRRFLVTSYLQRVFWSSFPRVREGTLPLTGMFPAMLIPEHLRPLSSTVSRGAIRVQGIPARASRTSIRGSAHTRSHLLFRAWPGHAGPAGSVQKFSTRSAFSNGPTWHVRPCQLVAEDFEPDKVCRTAGMETARPHYHVRPAVVCLQVMRQRMITMAIPVSEMKTVDAGNVTGKQISVCLGCTDVAPLPSCHLARVARATIASRPAPGRFASVVPDCHVAWHGV